MAFRKRNSAPCGYQQQKFWNSSNRKVVCRRVTTTALRRPPSLSRISRPCLDTAAHRFQAGSLVAHWTCTPAIVHREKRRHATETEASRQALSVCAHPPVERSKYRCLRREDGGTRTASFFRTDLE